MNSMRISLKPKTTMGKWSTGLIIAFFLFFAVFLILVAAGQPGGDTFFSNLALTIAMLLAVVSGVSALATGIIGIAKKQGAVYSLIKSLPLSMWSHLLELLPHHTM